MNKYDETVLMPIPVTPTGDSRMMSATKFLSWLTAMLLAASVLVALLAVTNERNNLQEQLAQQSVELACRSAAAVDVNAALVEKQHAVAHQNVIVGDIIVAFIYGESADTITALTQELDQANDDLRAAGTELDMALKAQQDALTNCTKTG